MQSMRRGRTHQEDVQRKDRTVIKSDDDFPLRVKEVDGIRIVVDNDDRIAHPFVNLMFNADKIADAAQRVVDQVRAVQSMQEGLRILHGLS
jgi:hypothetical protein